MATPKKKYSLSLASMKNTKVYCRLLVLVPVLILSSLPLRGAVADTVETYSPAMHKSIRALVIKPQAYIETTGTTRFPVVYLLHGHGGNFKDWARKVPQISAYADLYNFIIVCPDGNTGSWYFDSPEDSSYRYETYVSRELVTWVDQHYRTDARRESRAITGLSMGGHGALYLAFRHTDTFGAAGSMSGGVDLRPFPNNWDLPLRLGKYAGYPKRWEENSVTNMIDRIVQNPPALIIDCGVDDFFYTVNVAFHDKLCEKHVAHDFISRPGNHSWDYWRNAVGYQFLFMHQYFDSHH